MKAPLLGLLLSSCALLTPDELHVTGTRGDLDLAGEFGKYSRPLSGDGDFQALSVGLTWALTSPPARARALPPPCPPPWEPAHQTSQDAPGDDLPADGSGFMQEVVLSMAALAAAVAAYLWRANLQGFMVGLLKRAPPA